MFRRFYKPLKIILFTAIGFTVILLINDYHVSTRAEARLFENVHDTPSYRVGVVLGTSKYAEGSVNHYYRTRISAAVALYHAGKIDGILVSGDNATLQYDEPTMMQKDLIKRGVPAEYITKDYAGFRTLDSMVRAQKVFDLQEFLIISQKFHCERALYISDAIGISAAGFCAEDVPVSKSLKVRTREVFARAMAFIDLNVLDRQPRYLGNKEQVKVRTVPQSGVIVN